MATHCHTTLDTPVETLAEINESMTAMTRRAVLTAAPAVMLTTAGTAPAASDASSPFLPLFAAWRTQRARVNAADMDAPEYDDLFAGLLRIEREVSAMPPASALDFAVKIAMADDDQDMNVNAAQRALAAEALAMIGEVA